MRLLRHPLFLVVSLSHWIVDVLNGQVGILLAVLSGPLGLTNAGIGLIATFNAVLSSLTQPLFGWLSDRVGDRWLTAGGVLWMAGFFSLVAITPGFWPIVFLILGCLGSAAFHPAGTMKAVQVGHTRLAGQAATAASLFILFGQGGLSMGPGLGGLILDHLGRPGLLALTALALPIGLLAAWQLRPAPAASPGMAPGPRPAAISRVPDAQPDLAAFALVIGLAGLRTWAQTAVTTFAPKHFHDLGMSPSFYGAIVALFMGGSAIGGVLGGMLSDRWNRRWTITLAMAGSVVPFYFLPAAQGYWLYFLAPLTGLLNGGPHSVFISMAQRMLPGRAAFASGLTLGFMFTAGAVGAYLSGLAADSFGLVTVLRANAGLAACAALLSLALRPRGPAQLAAVVAAGD
jgi:FSR family fosmidomycin resistance protein-like MFS transporter